MHLHVSYKPNAIMGQNNQLQAIFCDLRERSLWYRDLSFPHLARVTSNTTNPIIEIGVLTLRIPSPCENSDD